MPNVVALDSESLDLDPKSVEIIAYARRERLTAVSAARMHLQALGSERVPRLALKYSNYLSPPAKLQLLEKLQGGANKLVEIRSLVVSSVREAAAPYAELMQGATNISKVPAYVKSSLVVVIGLALLFAAWRLIAAIPLAVMFLWPFVVAAGGYWTFVSTALQKRTPVLVTNEVALEIAGDGAKAAVKDRLQLTLVRHGVQLADSLVDEVWSVLTPERRKRAA